MGANDVVHPSGQTLQSYGLGKLDDASAESVNNHLSSCPDCQRRVAEMSSDSFLGRLRGAHERPKSSATDKSQFGASLIDAAPAVAVAPPSAETLPPGLADHPDYEIKRELGRGGMGVVYLAHNKLMGRDEVLKVMSRHLMERPGVLERFHREIRAVGQLRHPNIVTAYHATRIGDSIVFAMEYVEGLDLSRMVKAKGALPVAHACFFVHEAALGLQHAHEEDLVHRDIKPGNLMLSRRKDKAIVKILDFGLARVTREEKVDLRLTSDGQVLGTPDYIAPEQIIDAPSADIRADIYSLGGTLYHLLTGRPPFQTSSLYDTYQAHISRDADPLNFVRPEVPAELAALVAKMMAKDPGRRFQTPNEVAQALTPFFKKDGTGVRNSIGEFSRVEQPGTVGTPAGRDPVATHPASTTTPVSPLRSAVTTARPEQVWESLVELRNEGTSTDTAPSIKQTRRPPWVWPSVAAAVLLLGLFVVWALKVQTPDGVIVLENVPKDAEILVDGTRIIFNWPGDRKPVQIRAVPGQRKLEVIKDGLKVFGPEVVLVKADGTQEVSVRLEPLVAVRGDTREAGSNQNSSDLNEVSLRTKAILDALEKPIPMKFPDETTLDDGLKYIKQETKDSNKPGIPIYVDPLGLSAADKTMNSTFRNIDLPDKPLRFTLKLMLDQLDLAYCVKDDVLIISSISGIENVRKEAPNFAGDATPSTKETLDILERPTRMPFETETPLEDVIEHIKKTTRNGETGAGVGIFVHPAGLREAEKTMSSKVRNLDLEDVPLKTTLRLLLKQLDLAYIVKEGVLFISSSEIIQKETADFEKAVKLGDSRANVEPTVVQQDRADPARADGNLIARGQGVFLPLFNGQDLSGWKDILPNGSEWEVVNGVLEGRGGGERGPAVLLTDRRDFTNFRLRVKLRYPSKGAGRIEIRHTGADENMSGYQVAWAAMNDVPTGSIGKATEPRYGARIDFDQKAEPLSLEVNQWYTIEISAIGDRITTSLNGRTVLDFTDPAKTYAVGGIAMLCGYDSNVQIQEILINELPATGPRKPTAQRRAENE